MLKIENLCFTYESYPGLPGLELFRDAALTLPAGKMGMIWGSPESGKSTLAGIIARLIPEYGPGEMTGKILLGNQDITDLPARELINQIGYVFQDPEKQIITTTCKSEAVFALEAYGLSPEEIDRRIQVEFDLLGISHLLNRNPMGLSGGEKKRLMIAILLACDASLFLLDEPLEELDPSGKNHLLTILKQRGKSVLIFTSKPDLTGIDYFDCFWKIRNKQLASITAAQMADYTQKESPVFRAAAPSSAAPEFSGDDPVLPVLTVENLVFSYKDRGDSASRKGKENSRNDRNREETELEGFSLSVPDFFVRSGEIVGLVGPNGSGKSTFARLLTGLLEPVNGKIMVKTGESEELRVSDSTILNRMGDYLFQNPDFQIFMPTLGEELMFSLNQNPGLSKKEKTAARDRLIQDFSLPEGHTPSALMSFSGRKRLQYGCYQPLEKGFLILDEADSGIENRDFPRYLDALRSSGTPVVIISHNLSLAASLCSRFYCFYDGVLKETSPEAAARNLLPGGIQ